MATQTDPRINELLDLAAEQGQPLAMRPETVIAVEDAGWVINPFTGAMWRARFTSVRSRVRYLEVDHADR